MPSFQPREASSFSVTWAGTPAQRCLELICPFPSRTVLGACLRAGAGRIEVCRGTERCSQVRHKRSCQRVASSWRCILSTPLLEPQAQHSLSGSCRVQSCGHPALWITAPSKADPTPLHAASCCRIPVCSFPLSPPPCPVEWFTVPPLQALIHSEDCFSKTEI